MLPIQWFEKVLKHVLRTLCNKNGKNSSDSPTMQTQLPHIKKLQYVNVNPLFFSIKNSLSAVTLQTICISVVLFALFIQKTIMNDSTAPLSYECDRLGSNDDNFFFQQNIINIFTARFIKNSPLL